MTAGRVRRRAIQPATAAASSTLPSSRMGREVSTPASLPVAVLAAGHGRVVTRYGVGSGCEAPGEEVRRLAMPLGSDGRVLERDVIGVGVGDRVRRGGP